MKKRYDVIQMVALVCVLAIAIFINNTIVKGIILLLFSSTLIVNTVIRLKEKTEDKFKNKFVFGILLFFELILLLSAVFIIASSLIRQ